MPVPRVLIVDDDVQVRGLLQLLVKMEGYSAEAVACGKEALPLLAERDFSILVTDLKMPGMSGLELIRKARERGWRGLVLASFASPDELSGETPEDLGNVEVIRKPFPIGSSVEPSCAWPVLADLESGHATNVVKTLTLSVAWLGRLCPVPRQGPDAARERV